VESSHRDLIEKAKAERETIKKHFAKLKKSKGKEADNQFHKNHEEFFKKNDCLTCANCCKTTSPIFRDVDIKRISKQLKLKESTFVDKYLKIDEEQDYVLKSSPCPFLDLADNTCNIYAFRPLACAEYPHTDRKNMVQILDLTSRNAEMCPAVASIVLQIINSK